MRFLYEISVPNCKEDTASTVRQLSALQEHTHKRDKGTVTTLQSKLKTMFINNTSIVLNISYISFIDMS